MVVNKITSVPQPARSILRGYPDIEAVARLHARYLEAVASGDDAAIQEAQQQIETLLDGENQIFEQRNRPERVRFEPENNRLVVKRGGTTPYKYGFPAEYPALRLRGYSHKSPPRTRQARPDCRGVRE